MNKDVIKVFVGQRRVGKSYLLFQVMDELLGQGVIKTDILYINEELHEFDAIRDYPKFVVSMDSMIEGGEKGIRHMHIRRFLETML